MDSGTKCRLEISNRVLITAPADSSGSKHNGKVGRISGFVRNWFVLVRINDEDYRFYPTDLTICS